MAAPPADDAAPGGDAERAEGTPDASSNGDGTSAADASRGESRTDAGRGVGRPDSADDESDHTDPTDETAPGGRDVPVPLRVYKAVTVFSTLFAVAAVVAGFVILDTATRRASLAPEDVNVVLALAGLGVIALGAVVYAFSTRFRAEGMGRLKDDAD